MSFTKVTYTDKVTHISAKNLNDIQNEIVNNSTKILEVKDDSTEAIDELKGALIDYNCLDAFAFLSPSSKTSSGVYFGWNEDGSCRVVGTATSEAYVYLFYNYNDFAPFFAPGSALRLKVNITTNTVLKIWFYKNNTYYTGYSLSEDTDITVPSDAEGLVIRLQVNPGVSVDETVKWTALTTYTNAELYALLKQNVLDKRLFASDNSALPGCDLNTIRSGAHFLVDDQTYTNAPSYNGNPVASGYLIVYHISYSCLQIFYAYTGGIIWKRRMTSWGEWQSWIQVTGTTNNYNNNYTFQNYENTYNLTANPTINASNDNYLAPTGTTADVTSSIVAMLNSTGACRLGPGNYYIKNLVMPMDSAIIGCGAATKVYLIGTDDAFAIKLNSRCVVKDLELLGGSTDITPTETIGNRHAILWQGSYTENQSSPRRGIVSGLYITRFSGGGITCYDTGYGIQSCIEVCDCYIYNCGAGINISYWSEFNKFTNVQSTGNYYGCINNGGNNTFANCDFSGNKMGLLVDNSNGQSPNNTHGSFAACMFNHSDSNNGTAIKILGGNAGLIFTASQIFFGGIDIENSIGIRFIGANFGSTTPINVVDSSVVCFSDCTFLSASASPVTESGNTRLVFDKCYTRDGAAFRQTA